MKHTITTDSDKADLIQQYQWAIDRLDNIVASPPANDNARTQAIVDEAKILRKVTRLMKKLILHELR